MTIAACHLSPEGVVLGADSATTISGGPNGTCHLDYAQKILEVGPPGASIGLVTWGLGQIGQESHRTIAADLGFRHATTPFASLEEMAQALAAGLWTRFTSAYAERLAEFNALLAKISAKTATIEDMQRHNAILDGLSGGYCLAGRVKPHGQCQAFQILWGPNKSSPLTSEIPQEVPVFWGVPQIMERLLYGFDSQVIAGILDSGKWGGTQVELIDLVMRNQLMSLRLLPIREAIDWVHTVIHTTIRGTKFAKLPHWCGGPVEIAAITTDRPFRWVRHKPLDAAIITAEEARQ